MHVKMVLDHLYDEDTNQVNLTCAWGFLSFLSLAVTRCHVPSVWPCWMWLRKRISEEMPCVSEDTWAICWKSRNWSIRSLVTSGTHRHSVRRRELAWGSGVGCLLLSKHWNVHFGVCVISNQSVSTSNPVCTSLTPNESLRDHWQWHICIFKGLLVKYCGTSCEKFTLDSQLHILTMCCRCNVKPNERDIRTSYLMLHLTKSVHLYCRASSENTAECKMK